MTAQDRRIETDLFFGGIGVEFTTQGFQAIDDVVGFAPFGAFKGHMLPEMGQSLLIGEFVPTTDIQHHTQVGNFGVSDLIMHYADAVGQFNQLKILHGSAKLADLLRILATRQ